MDYALKKEIIDYLNQFLTTERKALFERVLSERTEYMTLVLEDIYHAQNASAVLRTAECHGIQSVHIIENEHKYEVNPKVVIGASKWTKLHHYNELENNTSNCIQTLKDQGYRIVATSPHPNGISLSEFDVTKGKFALMFGSEKPGLTNEAIDLADEYITIPMYGFTESYNISVSAGICCYDMINRLKNSEVNWQLPEEEWTDLWLDWSRKSLNRPEVMEREFLRSKGLQ